MIRYMATSNKSLKINIQHSTATIYYSIISEVMILQLGCSFIQFFRINNFKVHYGIHGNSHYQHDCVPLQVPLYALLEQNVKISNSI